MKNFFKRIIRLFSIKGNKALKKYEDSIEVYEYELGKSKENLEKLADSQSKLRSEKRVVADKKAKAEGYIQSLQRILDRAVEQEDDALGEETMALIESNQKKVEMFQVNIDSYENVITQMEQQYATLKEKYNEKVAKLDGLKAQSEFAKNMEAINKELKNHYSEGEFDFASFEKIEEELKGKIYYEQDRNVRFTPEPSLEERVESESRKSKFQEYKEAKRAARTQAIDAPRPRIEILDAVTETAKAE